MHKNEMFVLYRVPELLQYCANMLTNAKTEIIRWQSKKLLPSKMAPATIPLFETTDYCQRYFVKNATLPREVSVAQNIRPILKTSGLIFTKGVISISFSSLNM